MRKIWPFLFFAVLQAEEAVPYVSSYGVYANYLVKSFVLIIVLLIFMYYWYRHILPKIQSQNNRQNNLRIKEKLALEPGTALYVLEIKGAHKLLIVSSKQTACYDLPKLEYKPAVKKEFSAYLAEFLPGKAGKKSSPPKDKKNVHK
ncbi:MAG: hypothetical protein LBD99_01670 [Candidatus Margulisbacteria bacterium]|jgi:flagellar biogenesis protein FliO|nr:hypothetical protein [Candidatus Margulisiibacteriota bacterium]